jgi:hypothetical protein
MRPPIIELPNGQACLGHNAHTPGKKFPCKDHQTGRVVHVKPSQARVETKIFVFVFFRFSRKKLTKIFVFAKGFAKVFAKISHSECRSGSRSYLNVYPDPNTSGIHLKFSRKPSREQKFFAKTFAQTKIFAKTFAKTNIFAKSERIFAYFRFSRK